MGVPRTLAKGLSKLKEAAELRKLGGTTAERMARAAVQGYDTSRVLYHGGTNDFDAFAESRRGVYLSDNPDIAGIYANNAQKRWPGQNNAEPNIIAGYAKGKPLVVSDQGPNGGGWLSDNMAKALNVSLDDVSTKNRAAFLNDEARRQGYGYVEIRDMDDLGGRQTQIRLLDNGNFRSVNADFNPEYKDSSNLLAGIAGAMPYAGATAALLAGATPQEAEAGTLSSGVRFIKNLKGAKIEAPRIFYRGVRGGGDLSVSGRQGWDSHLFAASDVEKAKLYGDNITTITAKPEAKILYEGTAEWRKVAGAWRKDESLLDYADRASEAAKKAGYDAAWFKRQGDAGTTIFNKDAFDFSGYAGTGSTGPLSLAAAAGLGAMAAGSSNEAEAGTLQTLGRAAPYLTSAALGGAAALQSGDAEAGIITRGGRRLIEAWHGSPHSFDKFDISKIGTGEGAQAYGHGLYFADAKDTARQYRDELTDGFSIDGQVYASSTTRSTDTAHNVAANALSRFNGDKQQAIGWLEDFGREGEAKRILQEAQDISPAQGNIYRTEIDVDPDTLLDWDKPLSEQSEAVQAALKNAGHEFLPYKKGQDIASGVPGATRAEQAEYLRGTGIPGIRYLDGMSRTNTPPSVVQDGDKFAVYWGNDPRPVDRFNTIEEAQRAAQELDTRSYNYVMFDDKPISIVERGNASPALLAATAVGTGAGMYAASDAEAGTLDALGRAAPYLATGALGAAMMTPQDAQAGGMPEYERRLSQIPYPNIDNGDGSRSTHEMAVEVDDNGNWFAFPTIQPGDNGQLQRFELRDAQQRAMATGNYKAFGQDKDAALQYGAGGYKTGTNIEPPPQSVDMRQYMQDALEARTAADRFTQMRGSKAGYWEARRQELLDMVSGLGALAGEVADVALRSPTNQAIYGIASMNSDKIWHDADMPLRSLLAGGGVIRDAAQWQNLQAIGQNAQQIINTPSEQTTYGVGGAVTDALSPYTTPEAAAAAGALVHGGIQIASPF